MRNILNPPGLDSRRRRRDSAAALARRDAIRRMLHERPEFVLEASAGAVRRNSGFFGRFGGPCRIDYRETLGNRETETSGTSR